MCPPSKHKTSTKIIKTNPNIMNPEENIKHIGVLQLSTHCLCFKHPLNQNNGPMVRGNCLWYVARVLFMVVYKICRHSGRLPANSLVFWNQSLILRCPLVHTFLRRCKGMFSWVIVTSPLTFHNDRTDQKLHVWQFHRKQTQRQTHSNMQFL